MKLLLTVASRHGSTWAIGAAVREELAATGLEVDLLEPCLVQDIGGYDAVVIGSGVYAGRWLEPARTFIQRFEAQLLRKAVWLFSSGPIGDPPKPTQPAAEALAFTHRLGAQDHQVFEGRLESSGLGMAERVITRVVGASTGDYRPWLAIRTWARRIAASLGAEPAAQRGPTELATPTAARG